LLISIFAIGCSNGAVDPHRIDGRYFGQSSNYREMTLEIDRTDDAITGDLLLLDSAGDLVFDGAVIGSFWSPTQFRMQGTFTVEGETRHISLEGIVVHDGLAVTINGTGLPEDTLVLRRR
jgi:hypothetical protein